MAIWKRAPGFAWLPPDQKPDSVYPQTEPGWHRALPEIQRSCASELDEGEQLTR